MVGRERTSSWRIVDGSGSFEQLDKSLEGMVAWYYASG